MSEEKLKPCPFCGGEAKLYSRAVDWLLSEHVVRCKKCHCMTDTYDTKVETIEAWNRRVADDGKTLSCFKCHGSGTYKVIDPDYSWNEHVQLQCGICKGTGKITLEAYEWFQKEMRDKK